MVAVAGRPLTQKWVWVQLKVDHLHNSGCSSSRYEIGRPRQYSGAIVIVESAEAVEASDVHADSVVCEWHRQRRSVKRGNT